jgi:hypothetical protein
LSAKPASFKATLFRYPGTGGWFFAPVPEKHAPAVTHGWGRTPVAATVDGREWETSVWRGKDGQTLLAVPKRIRGAKGHGDTVVVTIVPRISDTTLKTWLKTGRKRPAR